MFPYVMKKTVLFVLTEQYADWEAAYLSSAIHMLGGGDYEVKTISLKKEYIRSIGGFNTMPDYDINSVPLDYEALILIGGMTWRNEDKVEFEPLIKKSFADGKILGGICDASAFLGTIGILNNVNHTSNDLKDLKKWAGNSYSGEENYTARQAVRHKNVITANGTATLEFAKEVLNALNIAPKDKIDEWYNFHKLGLFTAGFPDM